MVPTFLIFGMFCFQSECLHRHCFVSRCSINRSTHPAAFQKLDYTTLLTKLKLNHEFRIIYDKINICVVNGNVCKSLRIIVKTQILMLRTSKSKFKIQSYFGTSKSLRLNLQTPAKYAEELKPSKSQLNTFKSY